jgi:hypothetical protein
MSWRFWNIRYTHYRIAIVFKTSLMAGWIDLGPTIRLSPGSGTQIWCYSRADTQMQQDVDIRFDPSTQSLVHSAGRSGHEQDSALRCVDPRFDELNSEGNILGLSLSWRHRKTAAPRSHR